MNTNGSNATNNLSVERCFQFMRMRESDWWDSYVYLHFDERAKLKIKRSRVRRITFKPNYYNGGNYLEDGLGGIDFTACWRLRLGEFASSVFILNHHLISECVETQVLALVVFQLLPKLAQLIFSNSAKISISPTIIMYTDSRMLSKE